LGFREDLLWGYAILGVMEEDCWKPIIEPASPEEIAVIEEGEKDYRDNPESFIPLASIR
jgi:hypothetical protein